MVNTPANSHLNAQVVLAVHAASSTDLAVIREALDGVVDNVNGVLVANVSNVGALDGAVGL